MRIRIGLIFLAVFLCGLMVMTWSIFNKQTHAIVTTDAAPTVTVTPSTEPVDSGPLRVGLQAGHWKNLELPDEFERLREQGGGATVGSITEWEVNLDIAQRIAKRLEAEGIIVDILPATIPQNYSADLFVSIHADGNEDTSVTGFKVAPSELDPTNRAELASGTIESSYKAATNMTLDPNVTADMTRYYAFNYIRFHHSIAESTPGVIVEVGYLTSAKDRRTIVANPEVSAEGVATGILNYFEAAGEL